MTDYEIAELIIVNSDGEEIVEDEPDLIEYEHVSHGIRFEYYVGYEIASLLGYKNTKSVIKNNVSKYNQLSFREYPGVKNPPLDPRTILITSDGAVELLLKTRKRISPDVIHLLKKFGIETTNRKCLTKEQQTLYALTNAFKTESFEDQFKIGTYFLDLYFSDYRLVIECDENGHADRRRSDERKRMDYVNKELEVDDSHWIRFNPDEENFDISSVIGKIFVAMKTKGVWKPKYVPPTKALKNINLDPEKPCNTCKVVKQLTEFNPASDHRDKRENVCTICRRKRQEEILIEKKESFGEVTEIECNICKELLCADKFYKDKNSPTGRMRRCKECHKNKTKEMQKKEKIIISDKKCTCCGETKEVKHFHKKMCSRDGYNIYCKICACAKAKELSKK
jgi:very-short-patch-repair endonuclease